MSLLKNDKYFDYSKKYNDKLDNIFKLIYNRLGITRQSIIKMWISEKISTKIV